MSQETAYVVTFTIEVFNGKLLFCAVIPNFYLNFWCENVVETHSFRRLLGECSKLGGNCVFPQNFLIKKLGEISLFFEVRVETNLEFVLKTLPVVTDELSQTHQQKLNCRFTHIY